MCAISGIVDLDFDPSTINKMLLTMKRRGPDDSGCEAFNRCCLLHTRLAVIDPESGKQPMSLAWIGEMYTIVYNGELYNTDEIRKELLRLGHNFLGHSDTEVVLHAYAQWKSNCLERFNGIFAFAIWNESAKHLFLARDRMGVKPLFYRIHNEGLIFASEIKTILKYPGIKAELDADGVAELLLIGPGRIPGSGVFNGIHELKPGFCADWAEGRMHLKQYWSLKDREHTESFKETAEHIRFLVTDAIRRQMVSDVPLGTFLSGGLDSSLISAICAKHLYEKGEKLKTFSVDYKDNEKYFVPGKFQPDSDNAYIGIMQKTLGTIHHGTVLTPEDLLATLEEATVARDLPGMADVDFSLHAFCKEIKKEVTVALSGECADEIFGGYPWYRDPEILASNGFPWAQNTKARASLLNIEFANKIKPEEFVNGQYINTVSECDILPGTSENERKIKQMVNLNQKWFMQTLLDRKDRMSMYHGLEVRVPFCDHQIAEYMYGVPWEYKDYRHKEKGLLRYAMSDTLPEQILWRKKNPYPKTHDPAYLNLVSKKLAEVLQRNDAPILQIIRKDALEQLLNTQSPWPWYGQLMRTPQTIAYMLQINFWLTHYKVQLI